MKCPKCGSNDVTQSKGKCNECLWAYEEEQRQIKRLKESNFCECGQIKHAGYDKCADCL